ncbi:cation efflux system protein CusF, partial [Klebsiella pneumoniae]
MNSLSKITLFTLLSGAVFATQAADPHAGMAMHEEPAAAQAQSIRGKGVIKAIDMD